MRYTTNMKHAESSTEQATRTERARVINEELTRLFGSPKTVLNYSNTLELLIAVILSAQCTDKKVNEVTEKLFKKYPTFESYLNANQEEFEQDIRSTGFYKNKTKSVLGMVQKLHSDFDDRVPDSIAALITLPGVARKTANVVMGNAFGRVEGIAIDTHMRRLSNKFKLSDESDPDKIEQDLMKILPKEEWFDFTYRLISYGREYSPAKKIESYEDPVSLTLKEKGLL